MKSIKLGDIQIEGYNEKTPLYPDWMIEDSHYKREIKETKENDVILPAKTSFELVIDYPLSNEFRKKFKTGVKGMTRRQFINLAVKSYKYVYDTEDKDVGHKTGNIKGMYNRQTSEGRYGIWGHALGDLVLHTAYIKKGNVIELGVDS